MKEKQKKQLDANHFHERVYTLYTTFFVRISSKNIHWCCEIHKKCAIEEEEKERREKKWRHFDEDLWSMMFIYLLLNSIRERKRKNPKTIYMYNSLRVLFVFSKYSFWSIGQKYTVYNTKILNAIKSFSFRNVSK